jgi:hypothetical protein
MASIKRRPDGIWRARYRDEAGKEHAKHLARKVDAQRWLDEVTTSVVTGSYVDPKAGQITFAAYFEQWSARQVWVSGTVLAMKLAARSVTFSDMPLRSIRRSHIEAWVKSMNAAELAPGTVATRFNNVRAVFRAAHRDRIIGTDPTDGITPGEAPSRGCDDDSLPRGHQQNHGGSRCALPAIHRLVCLRRTSPR